MTDLRTSLASQRPPFVPPIVQRQRIFDVPQPGEQMAAWDSYHRAERVAAFCEWLCARGDGETLRKFEDLIDATYFSAPSIDRETPAPGQLIPAEVLQAIGAFKGRVAVQWMPWSEWKHRGYEVATWYNVVRKMERAVEAIERTPGARRIVDLMIEPCGEGRWLLRVAPNDRTVEVGEKR